MPGELGPEGPKILVAGLGNLLLRDDGVGVHAVRGFGKNTPEGVAVVEVGTAVLDALHLFEWADYILAIDAMKAGGQAGTIYSFQVSDVEDCGPKASMHELNLLAALRFLARGRKPSVLILGVEPEIIEFGHELSPKVGAVLPGVIHSAREIIKYWQRAEPFPGGC